MPILKAKPKFLPHAPIPLGHDILSNMDSPTAISSIYQQHPREPPGHGVIGPEFAFYPHKRNAKDEYDSGSSHPSMPGLVDSSDDDQHQRPMDDDPSGSDSSELFFVPFTL